MLLIKQKFLEKLSIILPHQKGKNSSPEKNIEINGKRTFNQNKFNSNKEKVYNVDEKQQEYQVAVAVTEEEDDENYIWSGFISLGINKKGKCGMDAKVISSERPLEFDGYNLSMTTKCPITDCFKKPPFAVLLFKPTNETYFKPFKDVKQFLNSNNNKEAGVIHTKNCIFYLLPQCEQAVNLYPQLKEGNILAICHATSSQLRNLTKKENKIDKKQQKKDTNGVKENNQKQQEEEDLVYDPTSILKDSSNNRDNEEHKDQEQEVEQNKELLYDPNEINNENEAKNTDLYDLIDDPTLLNNMMKSFN